MPLRSLFLSARRVPIPQAWRLVQLLALTVVLGLGAVAGAQAQSTLLPSNSVWKYEAGGGPLASDWNTTGFDDSGWASGNGILGYGETYITTTVPFGVDPNNKPITVYLRTSFTLTDPPGSIASLLLGANYDDGFVAYLNGVEVARRGLTGTVTETTLADNHESGIYETISISPSALVPGTNVLAVEVHQYTVDSSDLAWDADLISSPQPVVLPRNSVWKYEASGGPLASNWNTAGYSDATWDSGIGILGYGEAYISTAVPYGADPNNKPITVYFRSSFTLVDPPGSITSLLMGANYDDGFVAYINGVEVARRGLTGTVTNTTTAASHEGGVYETIALSPSALISGTNLIAVEVHQRTANSSDLVWDADLITSTQPALLTRGPYLQVGTSSSMTFRWRTDNGVTSGVWIGTSPGSLSLAASGGTTTTEHELTVTGLSAETQYYYGVGTSTTMLVGGGVDHQFITSPVPGAVRSFRVWAIGDAGTADASAEAVRDGFGIFASGAIPEVWLMLGDNAYNTGTDTEYQAAVFDMYPSYLRQTPAWPTRGNHDVIHSGTNNDYYDIFTLPAAAQAGGVVSGTEAYYSFDYANVHFVCLDSQGSDITVTGPMFTWLQTDLANTTQDWVIAYWHHPPYTKGSHDSDDIFDSDGKMVYMRERALPFLEAAGVDLVLGGHSHAYERSFLLDGHYGYSGTLLPGMILDSGSGRPETDGAYMKSTAGLAPHEGAVYVVAGSSGKTSGGTLDHPVAYLSLNNLGSVVLDINGNQLDAVFIDTGGNDLDHFTIAKGAAGGVDDPFADARLVLSPTAPNPFAFSTRIAYSLPEAGPVRVTIMDVEGRRVRDLIDEQLPAGDHQATWNGLDDRGRRVAPGVYFTVLEFSGERRTRKLVLAR